MDAVGDTYGGILCESCAIATNIDGTIIQVVLNRFYCVPHAIVQNLCVMHTVLAIFLVCCLDLVQQCQVKVDPASCQWTICFVAFVFWMDVVI